MTFWGAAVIIGVLLLFSEHLIGPIIKQRIIGKPAKVIETPSTALAEETPDLRVADSEFARGLFGGSERDKLLPLLEAEKLRGWARSMRIEQPGKDTDLLFLEGKTWKTHYLEYRPRLSEQKRDQTYLKTKIRHEVDYYDLHLNKAQIARIWDIPSRLSDRIPCTALLALAEKEGWDFSSHSSLHLIDLQDAMRQGGLDSTLTIWGREKKFDSDQLMQGQPLEKIFADHWKDHDVNLFGALEADNFNTFSWLQLGAPGQIGRRGYIDLHVLRSQATQSLMSDAAAFMGRKKPR